MSRYRHRKRGTTYRTLTLASLQTAAPVPEGTLLVVYESADGKVWARPKDEFFDGRFEKLEEDF